MGSILPVPYERQIADGYCLVACVQMVFNYLGISHSHKDLTRQLGVRPPFGAPASNVTRLRSASYKVIYSQGSIDDIAAWLARDIPVIAFIQAGELPFWRDHRFQHAVVLVGLKGQTLYVLDPAGEATPMEVSIGDFMLAWQEMDFMFAVITG